MTVLDFLKRIFLLVFLLDIFSTTVQDKIESRGQANDVKENASSSKTTKKPNAKWENVINLFLIISVIFLTMALFILVFKSILNHIWIFLLLCAPIWIKYLTGVFIAIGTVGSVVKSNGNGHLSGLERSSIYVFSYAVFFLTVANSCERILEHVNQISSSVLSDVLMALILVSGTFIYLFLIIARSFSVLYCGILLLEIVAKIVGKHFPLKKQFRSYGDYFVSCIDAGGNIESCLIHFIKYIQQIKCWARFFLYFLIPFVYLADIVQTVAFALFQIILSAIGCVVIIYRIAKKSIKALFLWILNLSDKRIVVVSFRLALILALVSIVVFNRYQPIFKEYEASTASFEFLASSILIPVMFEWIYSIRKEREEAKNSEDKCCPTKSC